MFPSFLAKIYSGKCCKYQNRSRRRWSRMCVSQRTEINHSLLLEQRYLSVWCPLPLLRLCVRDPGGGGLRGSVPDARCDPARPPQQEVPVFFSALLDLGFRAGHAPGPAPVLCGRSRVHCADARLGRHRHVDGRWSVPHLPVSGIYP